MTTFCYPYKRGTGWRSQAFRASPGGFNPPGGHTGFDQAMPVGTPLYAPGDGVIRNSDWVGENYLDNPWWLTRYGGDMIVLDCTDGAGLSDTMPTFILAHLSDSIANVGQRVRKGQLIALSGNSGTATTGPHCHIEALPPGWDWNNGVYGRVNAEKYFTEWPEDITPSGSAALAPQGTTITPIKDWFDMATEAQLRKIVREENPWAYKNPDLERDDAYALLRATRTYAVKNNIELVALKGVVAQLAAHQGVAIDYDRIDTLIKDNLAGGIDVDINVKGGK